MRRTLHKQSNSWRTLFTRPLLPEGSSLEEILFVCLSVRHRFNLWHSISLWFCPLFLPSSSFPMCFALKFWPRPCPFPQICPHFCPGSQRKIDSNVEWKGRGKGKILGHKPWEMRRRAKYRAKNLI